MALTACPGNDPCSFRGGFEHHPGGPKPPHHLIGNRFIDDGNLDQVPLGVFNPLSDGLRDLVGFTQSPPHMAVSIPDHHQGAETESPPSFHHLGHPVNMNHPVSQFQCTWINLRQCLFLLDRNGDQNSGHRLLRPQPMPSPFRDKDIHCDRRPLLDSLFKALFCDQFSHFLGRFQISRVTEVPPKLGA